MGIISLLITIGGLYMASEFINLISGFITGGGNALSEGSGLASNVKGKVKGGLGKVSSGMGKTVGAFARAHGARTQRRQNLVEAGSKNATDAEKKALAEAESERDSISRWDLIKRAKASTKVRKAENAIKARTKVKKGDDEDTIKEKKAIQKEAGTGFFRSMGGSIGGGVLSTLGSVIKTTGFDVGAINEARKKGVGEGRTKTQETHKERSEGKYGELKALRAASNIVSPGENLDAGKLMGAFFAKLTDEVGKEALKVQVKDNPSILAGTGLAKDASYDTVRQQGSDVAKLYSMVERVNAATDAANKQREKNAEEAVAGLKARGYTLTEDQEKAAKSYFMGETDDTSKMHEDFKSKSQAQAFAQALAEEQDKLDKKNKVATSQVQTLTTQTLDFAKTIDTTGNGALTAIKDEITGQLQKGLNASVDGSTVKIEPGTKVSTEIGEKSLQDIVEGFGQFGKDFVKDLSKAEDPKYKEVLKALEKLNSKT